jgi:hypothetical protein
MREEYKSRAETAFAPWWLVAAKLRKERNASDAIGRSQAAVAPDRYLTNAAAFSATAGGVVL